MRSYPFFSFVLSAALSSSGSCLLSYKGDVARVHPGSPRHLFRMGVRSTVRDALAGIRGELPVPKLRNGIAKFYDASSGLWENMWGEHMHHGYYELGNCPSTLAEHRLAQVEMIEQSLAYAGVEKGSAKSPKTGVDIGCGIGGSSRHIAREFGTAMTGITLSPKQQNRAGQLSEAAGLKDKCQFQVMDALHTTFPSEVFELVWSMESGEHMPEKPRFVNELVRICAPGGRIIVVTWCHRDLEPSEESLLPREDRLLDRVSQAYYLPRWCSGAEYERLFEAAGLEDIRRDDWTDRIQYFWPAVIRSSLSVRGVLGLLKAGPSTIRGAFAMALMVRGFKKGLMKFVIITGRKPADGGDGVSGGEMGGVVGSVSGMPAAAT